MLISHPTVIFMHRPWMISIETACCFLSSLFPKVFCTLVLTWSIYVLVFIASYENICLHFGKSVLAIVVDLVGLLLYILSIYTYLKIIAVGAGSPLDFEELKIRNIESLSDQRYNSANPYDINDDTTASLLSQSERAEPEQPPSEYLTLHTLKTNRLSYRYCTKCSVWKPDRCHHCSTCKKCILRMDHHCPWFASCIGFYNHKFFIQFLVYATLYCGFVFIITLSLLWKFLADEEYTKNKFLSINLVVLFIISIAFFIAIGGFTAFSMYMLFKNTTTIEFQETKWNVETGRYGTSYQYKFDNSGKKRKLSNIFDLGPSRNWKSIMGPNWYTWALPITVTNYSIHSNMNNGINYEINKAIYDEWCYNARLQDQLNQQLADYQKRIRMERENTSV